MLIEIIYKYIYVYSEKGYQFRRLCYQKYIRD